MLPFIHFVLFVLHILWSTLQFFPSFHQNTRWLQVIEIKRNNREDKNHQINKLSRQHTNRKIDRTRKTKVTSTFLFLNFRAKMKRKLNCTQKLVQEKWYCPKNVCKKKISIFIYRDGMVNRIEKNRTKIQIHSLTLFLSPLSLFLSPCACIYVCLYNCVCVCVCVHVHVCLKVSERNSL